MSDSYVECMVARSKNGFMCFLKYLCIILAVVTGLMGLMGIVVLLFVAVAFALGAYFASTYAEVEYEYLYIDKELSIDRILAKSKRKRVATFEMDKIEIMAPLKSWHLDSFKNRTFTEVDYSSGIENMPETRYLFYYNGEKKVIFEPNEAMVKIMRNAAPRKVFVD